MDFGDVFSRKFLPDRVVFTRHSLERSLERGISKGEVLGLLSSDKLLGAEYQKTTDTYKLTYPISNNYFIIIVVALNSDIVNIVTVYKANKKIQKIQAKVGASSNVFKENISSKEG